MRHGYRPWPMRVLPDVLAIVLAVLGCWVALRTGAQLVTDTTALVRVVALLGLSEGLWIWGGRTRRPAHRRR